MGTRAKTSTALLILTMFILSIAIVASPGVAIANEHEESGSEMGMNDGTENGGSDGSAMGKMGMSDDPDMGKMGMGVTNTWQDKVNKISYPITAIVALLVVWICVLLMKATGMVDKFGLISIGLALFFIQAVVGVLFYLSNGTIVTMPTLMFVMSLFNSLALLLIGGAFWRWKRMIG